MSSGSPGGDSPSSEVPKPPPSELTAGSDTKALPATPGTPPVPTPHVLNVEEVQHALTAIFETHTKPAESALEKAVAEQVRKEHLTLILETAKLREENRHKETTDRLKNNPAILLFVIAMLLLFFAGCNRSSH